MPGTGGWRPCVALFCSMQDLGGSFLRGQAQPLSPTATATGTLEASRCLTQCSELFSKVSCSLPGPAALAPGGQPSVPVEPGSLLSWDQKGFRFWIPPPRFLEYLHLHMKYSGSGIHICARNFVHAWCT